MATATTGLLDQARAQHAALQPGCEFDSFNQIGVVADNLEAAAAGLAAELQISTWYRPRRAACWTWAGGKELHLSFEFLLGYCAGTQIELLKVGGPDKGIFGPAPGPDRWRLHHVGYFVRDIKNASLKLQASGLACAQTGVVKVAPNAKTRFSYWETGAPGTVVELIEQRVSGLRMGMPQWLVQFGAAAGYFERTQIHHSRQPA